MFARDRDRLADTRRRVNLMPMGSGALAGSGFDCDRPAMARELGFDGITDNSMDVSADRDFALDYLHAANTTALHLSRLAKDWILYSSDEFGWMELSDKVTSGSSLMPQKKHPDSLELIRGKAGRAFSAYASLFVTMKGLPLTYNRDMQEDKEPLFTVVDQLHGMLAMARNVIETTAIKPDRTRRRQRQLDDLDRSCRRTLSQRCPLPSSASASGQAGAGIYQSRQETSRLDSGATGRLLSALQARNASADEGK